MKNTIDQNDTVAYVLYGVGMVLFFMPMFVCFIAWDFKFALLRVSIVGAVLIASGIIKKEYL